MYDYGYETLSYDTGSSLLGGLFATMGLMMLILSAIGIITLISLWKIYKKAGKKGWECIVPIYNIVVLLEIVGLPTWYIALFFVPFANIYALFKIFIELAHKFGKTTGFGVLTAFFTPIFLPILAFGKNNIYQGINNQVNTQNNMMPPMNGMNNQYNQMNNMNNINNMQQPVMFNPTANTTINQVPTQTPVGMPQQNMNQNGTIPTPIQPVMPTPIINTNINQSVSESTQPIMNNTTINPIPEVNINQNVTPITEEPTINTQNNTIPQPVPMFNELQMMQQPPIINNPGNNFNQDNNQSM